MAFGESEGTIVSVPELDAIYPAGVGDSYGAVDLVTNKFAQAQTNADAALLNANAALAVLRTLFATASMPTDVDDIDYPTHDISLDIADIPEKPDEPADLTPGVVDVPTLADIPSVDKPSLGDISAPDGPTLADIPSTLRPTLGVLPSTDRPTLDSIPSADRPISEVLPSIDEPILEVLPSADRPTLGDVSGIEVPSIVVPDSDFSDLTTSFGFSEPAYSSPLIGAVKTALQSYISDGGTGLGADVEAAIWARARARKDLENERVYNEALGYFSARGFDIPPGALGGRLTEALKEQTRADTQINYEIMIEQARLAQTNSHHALTVSVNLEGIEKDFADKVAGRAFEKAKAACDIIISTYSAKVAAYVANMEGYKIKVAVADSRANAQIAFGNQVLARYTAEMEGYKAQITEDGYVLAKYATEAEIYEAQIAFGNQILAKYVAEIEGYKAQIAEGDQILTKYATETEVYKAQIMEGNQVLTKYTAETEGYRVQITEGDQVLTKYATEAEIYKTQFTKGNQILAKYAAEVEGYKAQVASGNQVLAKYATEMEGYKAQIAAELGIIESVAKVYGFKVAGYEAEAKVAVETLKVQIEAYKGQLIQSDNETQLTLKEAELTLQSYLGALALQSDAAKGIANVTAQVAASALNAVNASASVGASVGANYTQGLSHATHISNAASLGESHSYED